MEDKFLLYTGIILAIVIVGIFALLPKENIEDEIIKFLESSISPKGSVRLAQFQSSDVYEEAAAKSYMAELLSKIGVSIADREYFFRSRYEEEALSDFGLLKNTYFDKPETAKYSISLKVLKDSLEISVANLESAITRTKIFKRPEYFNKVVDSLKSIKPKVLDVKFTANYSEAQVTIMANYPFTQTLAVFVNSKSAGTYTLREDVVTFKIQGVKAGQKFELSIIPSNAERVGDVYSRTFVAEYPPSTVKSLSIAFDTKDKKVRYYFTYPDSDYPDLIFELKTPFGVYKKSYPVFDEPLVLGRRYEVSITAMGRYGTSEVTTFSVKTPPESPKVSYSISDNVVTLKMHHQNEFPVSYEIEVGGKRYVTKESEWSYRVPLTGINHTFKVSCVDGDKVSEPTIVDVFVKSPLIAPVLRVVETGDVGIITVDDIKFLDFKEFRIYVNGNEVARSNTYALKLEPDSIYNIKAVWLNTLGESSPEASLTLLTSPATPQLNWRQEGEKLIVSVVDPSKNVKAEGYELSIGGLKINDKFVDGKSEKVIEGLATGDKYVLTVHSYLGERKSPVLTQVINTYSYNIPRPTSVEANVVEQFVTLKWHAKKPSDFSHFIVVKKVGNVEATFRTTEMFFVDANVEKGKKVYYTVKTCNSSGICSEGETVFVYTIPEKPKVRYSVREGSIRLEFENVNEYPVKFIVKRDGKEVYRGENNFFEEQLERDGSVYKYDVYCSINGMLSAPETFLITMHSPLTKPTVDILDTGKAITIKVTRPAVKDYRETVIVVNGVKYISEVYSINKESDKIYNIKAYWVNTAGQSSDPFEVSLTTAPRKPLVDYIRKENVVHFTISDPSMNVKAEKFIIEYGARKFESSDGKLSIDLDENKILHEFRIYSVHKNTFSEPVEVIVVK